MPTNFGPVTAVEQSNTGSAAPIVLSGTGFGPVASVEQSATGPAGPIVIATTGKKLIPWGIFRLGSYSDIAGNVDPAADPSWINPAVAGFAARVAWSDIQSANSTTYNWYYLDRVLGKAVATGKMFSICIGMGSSTPSWAFATGFSTFPNANHGAIPAPWDTGYQGVLSTFLQALAARYDRCPNLAYVILSGVGWLDSFSFCTSRADDTALAAISVLGVKGINLWAQSVLSIGALYQANFLKTPAVVNFCAPSSDGKNITIAQSTFVGLTSSMGPLVGIKWNSVTAAALASDLPAYILFQDYSASNPVGASPHWPYSGSVP